MGYEELKNQMIDKTKPEFADFPDSIDGEIYIGGDAETGWQTQSKITPEESLNIAKNRQKAKLREEFINDALSAKFIAIDAAPNETAVKAVKLKG